MLLKCSQFHLFFFVLVALPNALTECNYSVPQKGYKVKFSIFCNCCRFFNKESIFHFRYFSIFETIPIWYHGPSKLHIPGRMGVDWISHCIHQLWTYAFCEVQLYRKPSHQNYQILNYEKTWCLVVLFHLVRPRPGAHPASSLFPPPELLLHFTK